MKRNQRTLALFNGLLLAACLAAFTGCSRSEPDPAAARTPEEAAGHLDKAFANAAPEVKQGVAAATDAMRRRQYQQAVMNLGVVQTSTNITLQQGLAIHGSMLTLEEELIDAMENGDPNAARAYQLLKALKRN